MERQLGKLAHAVLDAGGDDIVFGLGGLEDEPHALHVVLGVAPVAQRVEVAQIELVLESLGNACCGEGNLARHESLASALALVVEEDAVAAEHVVGVTIFLDNPVSVEFGDGIGAEGVEGRVLILRHFLYLAVELGCRGLVYLARLGESHLAHGFDDAQHAHGVYIGGELG